LFSTHTNRQFTAYNNARTRLISNPELLIGLEQYLTSHLKESIIANLDQIKDDYNEASYLFPFWKNYPPDDRGRQPIMDQYPWIEVGEHAIGCKLPRILEDQFTIRDVGLPTGADQRFVLTHNDILTITGGFDK